VAVDVYLKMITDQNRRSIQMTESLKRNRKKAGEKIAITALQIDIIKLKVKGYSSREIAEELKINQGNVFRSLKAFRKSYPKLRKWIKEVEKTRYFSNLMRKTLKLPERIKIVQEARRKKISKGFWPQNPPFGYKKKGNVLTVDPEKAAIVKQIFEGRSNGKTLRQLSTVTGLAPGWVGKILRNPVYMGKIRYKHEIYQGKHEAIISQKLWESVQPPPPNSRIYAVAPYGYKRKLYTFTKDPEAAQKVYRIFMMALDGKEISAISRATGVRKGSIHHIIHNPAYANRRKAGGKFIKGNWEPIVDFEIWQRVQGVREKLTSFEERKKSIGQERRKLGFETRRKILEFLPASSAELAEKTQRTQSAVLVHLRRMRAEGMVERGGGYLDGEWCITDEFRRLVKKS
jgi:DNA-binding MarR family transcriptional regulator/DNA invertase Pin-like site-specific DNA recombinase